MADELKAARNAFQGALVSCPAFEERVKLFEDFRRAETNRWLPAAEELSLIALDEFSRDFSESVEFLLKEAFVWALKQANAVCGEARGNQEPCLLWVLSPAAPSPGPGDVLALFLIFQDTAADEVKADLEKFHFSFSAAYSQLLGAGALDLPLPFGIRITPVPLSRFLQEHLNRQESTFASRAEFLKSRPVAGAALLTQTVLREISEYVFSSRPFHFGDAVRERVLRQNTANAVICDVRCSPGGLLDIEYLTVTLQLAYGRALAGDVRSTDTLTALYGLWRAGVLGEKHYQDLRAAYVFLTGLLRALKIHKGGMSADGALPSENSADFVTVGRLLGYRGENGRVYIEFKLAYQHHMAAAERMYEMYMVNLANQPWEDIPGKILVTRESARIRLEELLCGAPRPEDVPMLRRMGFLDMKALGPRFQALRPNMTAFEPFSRAMEKAWELWPAVPNPDLALEHLEVFMRKNEDPYRTWYALAKSDKGFRLLLHLFGTSRYLSGLLIRYPECWPWVEQTQYLSAAQSTEALNHAAERKLDRGQLTAVYQKEILRLAMADLFMGESFDLLMQAHSRLARFLLTELIKQIPGAEKISMLGLSGLGSGGQDLGPEWDLNLVAADDADLPAARSFLEVLTGGSSERTFVRLKIEGETRVSEKPAVWLYGKWLAQVSAVDSLRGAVRWCPAVCLAGPAELNSKIMNFMEKGFQAAVPWMTAPRLQSLMDERETEAAALRSLHEEDRHLILASGTLRDLEWSVFALWGRLEGAAKNLHPLLFLEMVKILETEKLLSGQEYWDLREAYLDFQKTLSRLRLMNHEAPSVLPGDGEDFRIFAKVMGFLDQGIDSAEERYRRHFARLRQRTRAVFERVFQESLRNSDV